MEFDGLDGFALKCDIQCLYDGMKRFETFKLSNVLELTRLQNNQARMMRFTMLVLCAVMAQVQPTIYVRMNHYNQH